MPDLSDLSEFANRGQELVTRAVESVIDLVPTADELLVLSQEAQNKVLSALKWNA